MMANKQVAEECVRLRNDMAIAVVSVFHNFLYERVNNVGFHKFVIFAEKK